MIIQIFGTPKCQTTRKAERFFRERDVPFQSRDVRDKPPSKGELEKLAAALGAAKLVGTTTKAYIDGGYAHRDFDPIEELLERPLLLATPIVRSDSGLAVGDDPAGWKRIADAAKV